MNNHLDHYCERILPRLWDEPFNVLTNIAFLLVAFLLFRKLRTLSSSSVNNSLDLWILIGLVTAIGVGSATWHLLAAGWALWADRIPILLFISFFLVSCLVRMVNLSITTSLVLLVIFHIINVFVQIHFPPPTLNGSVFYIPTFLFLITITFLLGSHHSLPVKSNFLIASVIFAIAIIFRSIDLAVCDSISIGTHFIWHLLIALTIYLLMTALIHTSVINLNHET